MRHFTTGPKPGFSFDLHVLGTPPAFVLSQDQTLQLFLENHPRFRCRLRTSEIGLSQSRDLPRRASVSWDHLGVLLSSFQRRSLSSFAAVRGFPPSGSGFSFISPLLSTAFFHPVALRCVAFLLRTPSRREAQSTRPEPNVNRFFYTGPRFSRDLMEQRRKRVSISVNGGDPIASEGLGGIAEVAPRT